MSGLNIRNLDPRVLEALRRRAKRNHRSLHGELHAILEQAAEFAPPPDNLPSLRLVMAERGPGDDADWSREGIYDDSGR